MKRVLRGSGIPALLVLTAAPAEATSDYVADYSGQIEIVASEEVPGPAFALEVIDGHLFVGMTDGLSVFDVANPEAPKPVGSLAVEASIRSLTGVGGLLLAAAAEDGFLVFDVSRPSEPTVVGGVDTPGYARRVAIDPTPGARRLAYVADQTAGVQIIDFGVPSAPTIRSALDFERAHGVTYGRGYLFVADRNGTFVMDVQRPSEPKVVAVLDEPESRDVQVVGETLYLGGYDYFQIYDVVDPAAPLALGRADVGVGQWGGAIHAETELAFVAAQRAGLYLLDVSNGRNPRIFWGAGTKNNRDVARIGPHHAVIATTYYSTGSIHIVDLRGRPSPSPVGIASLVGTSASDVAVEGDHAYTVGNEFRVVDVSDPTEPAVVGGLPYTWPIHSVVAKPPYAVYSHWTTNRLTVVDVSDPTSPQLAGDLWSSPPYDWRGLTLVGDLLYGTGRYPGGAGLTIVLLSHPPSPQVVSSVTFPEGGSTSHHVDVVGNIAYVATMQGLTLVDVTDPLLPVVLSHLDAGGQVRGVRVREGLAFLALYLQGFEIADVSDPHSPRLISDDVEGIDHANDVALEGNLAYVSGWGVSVVDVSRPQSPVLVGATVIPPRQIASASSIAFQQGLVYSGGSGLVILPRHLPSTSELRAPSGLGVGTRSTVVSSASPNPFRSSTTLAFAARRDSRAHVAVHDVAGRLVATLLDDRVSAGRHEVRWDGRDRTGRLAAPGVYFVRVQAGGDPEVRKVQRLR